MQACNAQKALSWFHKKAQIESLRLVCLNPLALAFTNLTVLWTATKLCFVVLVGLRKQASQANHSRLHILALGVETEPDFLHSDASVIGQPTYVSFQHTSNHTLLR